MKYPVGDYDNKTRVQVGLWKLDEKEQSTHTILWRNYAEEK